MLAWAQTPPAPERQDTLQVDLGYSVQTDSNLFRLSRTANPLSVLGTARESERIDAASATVSLDKSYSLQRFQLSAGLVNYRYDNFSYLSFNAFNYSAAWQWSLTPRVRGTLSTDRNQVANSYADFKSPVRNIRTDRSTRFDAEADLGAAVRLIGGLDSVRRDNEVSGVLDGDRESQGAFVGVRYIFPSSSTITYRLRKGDGESNNGSVGANTVLSNHFNEVLNEVSTSWAITGKTRLNGSLGYLNRKYPDAPQRNFSGSVADVNVQWDATGKLSVNAALRREPVSYLTDTSSFIQADRFILKPLWKATSRINVFSTLEYAHRNFDGSAQTVAVPYFRRDSYQLFSVGLEWRPIEAATITLLLQKMKNSSNYTGFDYSSNGASIAGKFRF